jgi:hypothetical protein
MRINEIVPEHIDNLQESFGSDLKKAMAAGAIGLAALAPSTQATAQVQNTPVAAVQQQDVERLIQTSEYYLNRMSESYIWSLGFLSAMNSSGSNLVSPNSKSNIDSMLSKRTRSIEQYKTDRQFSSGSQYAMQLLKEKNTNTIQKEIADYVSEVAQLPKYYSMLEQAIESRDAKKMKALHQVKMLSDIANSH